MTRSLPNATSPIRDLPRYLRIFQKYLGKRLYIIFALTLVAGLAEGVGILMVLPLLQGLDVGAPDAEVSGVAALLNDGLQWLGLDGSIVAVLLIITAAFILKGVLTFAALAVKALLSGQLLKRLKGQLFDDYSRMRYQYYASRDTGHFVNVINAQITGMLNAFTQFTQLATQVLNTTVYTALAFSAAWRFGLMALILGVGLLVLFRWLNSYVRDLSRRNAAEAGVLNKLLIQTLHAFKYLTATGQTARLRGNVTTSIGKLVHYQVRTNMAAGFTQAVREPLAVVFIMLIVMVQLVVLGQPLAPILVSIVLFYRGFGSILSIQSSWQAMLAKAGAIEMVDQEFSTQRHFREPDGDQVMGPLQQKIELDNVSFAYDDHLGPVVKSVSLAIPVRHSVAFVGESGAGKSTLVDLITLMLKPQQGEVRIDGVSGHDIALNSWREQIGYVSQETVVFDDTVANNICLWQGDPRRDSELMARVEAAAQQANLADFIETLPDGFHTLVGDRGMRLSGGQRQRLFIARELFRKPNVLILDEATSALDSESERAIQKSIDALRGQVTVMIIAHRLSTIRNVDRVYVFDDGRLIEQGDYEGLKDTEGSRFGELVRLQAL